MIRERQKIRLLIPLVFICAAILIPGCSKSRPTVPEGAVSKFGRYEKFSDPVYEQWARQSQYVAMRDGVKLAVDIVRPAVDGKAVEKPLPLVWTHDRYHRANIQEGKIYSEVDQDPGMQLLIRHGYIVAAVDVRGGGASYGRYMGTFSPEETRDAYEMTEWFAAQPWCDGNIGMYGGSYLGITQLMAASEAPPHLKAIFPRVAGFDLITFVNDGGIYREGFIDLWGTLTHRLDAEVPPVPVDEDPDRKMLDEAIKQHAGNWDVIEELKNLQFRDDEATAALAFNMPSGRIEAINKSGIPIYISSGWYDIYTRDPFQMLANFTNPTKVLMGPWPHGYWNDSLSKERGHIVNTEQLRWFDYWLKGIENGIMDEPRIHYAVIGTPGETWTWQASDSWPPEAEGTAYYFASGKSASIDSVNDGRLTTEAPSSAEAIDVYTADYSTNSGEQTRWHCGAGVELNYPDMTGNDRKGLTYTTPILGEDVVVVGHPLVTLYASSSTDDSDFFLYLEEVDTEGYSQYIAEGQLRASCRVLGNPPYNNLGLPFHPVSKEDVRKLNPGKPVEMIFDLLPVSNVFDRGNRIRVTLTCADTHVSRALKFDPSPVIKIHRSQALPSHIVLPVVKEEK